MASRLHFFPSLSLTLLLGVALTVVTVAEEQPLPLAVAASSDNIPTPSPDETFTITITETEYTDDNKHVVSTESYELEIEPESEMEVESLDGESSATGAVSLMAGISADDWDPSDETSEPGPAPKRSDDITATIGTSEPSGCHRRSASWLQESPIFSGDQWKFEVWARWCWNRATQTVYDVTKGALGEVYDWTVSYEGVKNYDAYFYDYSTDDGHPKSAYLTYRNGHFKHWTPGFGDVSNYCGITLRSYYNGKMALRINRP